jgi:hypothetical protein
VKVPRTEPARGRQTVTVEVFAQGGNLFPVTIEFDTVDASDVRAWLVRLRRNRVIATPTMKAEHERRREETE